jgi:ribosomal protein L7/L12
MSTGTQVALGVALAALLFIGYRVTRRRGPAPGPSRVSEGLTERLRVRIAEGKKVLAIKELRDQTGMSLRDARDVVDALDPATAPLAAPDPDVAPETLARARELVAARKPVQAVKVIRDETGWPLKRCKDIVDDLRGGRRRGD